MNRMCLHKLDISQGSKTKTLENNIITYENYEYCCFFTSNDDKIMGKKIVKVFVAKCIEN